MLLGNLVNGVSFMSVLVCSARLSYRLRQESPVLAFFSTTSASIPRRSSCAATEIPDWLPPTTSTSGSWFS